MVEIVTKLAPELGPEYPRPRVCSLHRAQLEVADVLLSRGTTDISDAIVASDGASYSHAALWSGDSVIEAIIDGIVERELCGERDVYRYVSPSGESLPTSVARALVEIARRHVGQRYAYSELLLLGVLYKLGVTPSRPVLNLALNALGGRGAERLAKWLQSLSRDSGPMMCSELVAHAYYEVNTQRTYALEILPRVERAPNPAQTARRLHGGPTQRSELDPNASDAVVLHQACAQLLCPFQAADGIRERKTIAGEIAVRTGTRVPLGVVTPGDLQFSPSLRCIGRITS